MLYKLALFLGDPTFVRKEAEVHSHTCGHGMYLSEGDRMEFVCVNPRHQVMEQRVAMTAR